MAAKTRQRVWIPAFAGMTIFAGTFALAELVAGLTIGQFVLRGRAEVAIFLAFRPGLLLLLSLAAMRRPMGERWRLYALAILLASGSEALLVWLLGAPSALIEGLRSAVASAALVLVLDLLTTLCGRLPGSRGPALAALTGLALIAVPGPLGIFERLALRGEPAAPSTKLPMALLTGLPLTWGEDAAGTYATLAAAFATQPIDVATSKALRGAKLLLVAQPRPPGAAGLVAIDQWVRGGGRALILTDPALRWPTDYALGDPRRPPTDDGLGPLLAHWGLSLEPPSPGQTLVTRYLDAQRIVMAAPGRFTTTGADCAIRWGGLVADCRIGRGRAALLPDADLLHDLLWVGPGTIGTSRAGRLADNAALVVRKLDELGGIAASPAMGRVDWITRPERRDIALLAAFVAPLSMFVLAFALMIRGRRVLTKKDSYRVIHSPGEKTKQEQ